VVVDVDIATSQSAVAAAEADKSGYWTEWLNVDELSSEWGTGEFETCSRIQLVQDEAKKCYLGCKAPIAVRYSLNDKTSATWSDIGTSSIHVRKLLRDEDEQWPCLVKLRN